MADRRCFHLPTRSEVHTGNPHVVSGFLSRSYGTEVRADQPPDVANRALNYSHTRTTAGLFAVESINQRGSLCLTAERLSPAVIYLPDNGHVECRAASHHPVIAGPGQLALAQCGDGSVHTRFADADLLTVVLDQALLAEAADSYCEVRFTGHRPVDEDAAAMFRRVADFVHHHILGTDATPTPRVVAAAGRLLACAALEAFAHHTSVPTDDTGDPEAGTPPVLRAAIDFIETNAHNDIGVSDIAAAVFLTPRSVQYIFRRHLTTTPTEYLRGVRLGRAHQDLMSGDRSATTVAATAARWGFAHTGRFAAVYRRKFGESPHETLSS